MTWSLGNVSHALCPSVYNERHGRHLFLLVLLKTGHKGANAWHRGFHTISRAHRHPRLSFFPRTRHRTLVFLNSTWSPPIDQNRRTGQNPPWFLKSEMPPRVGGISDTVRHQFIWGEGLLHVTCLSIVRCILISHYHVLKSAFRNL